MNHWVIAAAAFVPAIALATPITFTTSNSKTVTVKVKNKADSANSSAPAASTPPAASANNTGSAPAASTPPAASVSNTSSAPAASPLPPASTGNTSSAPVISAGGIGNALASDVTLGGISATQLVYGAGVNPQQGANGNSIGFAGAYGDSGSGDWSSFAKFSGTTNLGAVNSMLSGLTLTMGFGLTDMRHGTWSITNNSASNDLSLDLVFAMHTGGGSGSWLFDNYLLGAGSTALGAWSLNLLNNGGQLADYSNLTLFARNAQAAPVRVTTPAPVQPETAAPAAGSPEPVAAAPVVETAPVVVAEPAPAPAAGGVNDGGTIAIQIPIGELLEELNKHGTIEPGSQIEFEGLFGGGGGSGAGSASAAQVPEPGTLAVFLTGLALFAATARQRKRQAARR